VDHFSRKSGVLCAEDVPLPAIALACGTPTYVYCRATIERHYRVVDASLAGVDHLVCYAVKACSNLAILQLISRLGGGFDIVSGGELQRVLRAGGDPGKVVFSGVGKQDHEIAAALAAGILCFNAESEGELARIEAVARSAGARAPVSLRVNPEVDPRTHKYIATGLKSSKFGVTPEDALPLYLRAAASPHLQVVGLDCHIGSQILEIAPFVEALGRVIDLAERLRGHGIAVDHLDVGGGLAIPYRDETPALPDELGRALVEVARHHRFRLVVEPGRVIVGNAGVLLATVIGTKRNGDKEFVVVDAAMNDLVRPALYDAWHAISPVVDVPGRASAVVDVVGPVCESGDFLALGRHLATVQSGELLAVHSAGAYGFSMASNYNSRPRAAEVLVDGARWMVIRERERFDDLVRGERLLDGG